MSKLAFMSKEKGNDGIDGQEKFEQEGGALMLILSDECKV